jgi:hypothetical protein
MNSYICGMEDKISKTLLGGIDNRLGYMVCIKGYIDIE